MDWVVAVEASAMDEEKKSVSWRWILGALIAYPVIGYIAFWMLFGNPY